MRFKLAKSRAQREGYILILTVAFGAITLTILAGALSWSVNNMRMIARNNQYLRTVSAAEAATESVLTRLESDYQTGSDALIQANLPAYRLAVPTSTENSYWSAFRFGNDLGQTAENQVVYVSAAVYTPLTSQYSGLSGYASNYKIVSNARELNGSFNLTAGVQQNLQTATIPLFQFAIFYNMDMEVNPGPNMTITGPVHGNGNIYTQPQATLTFEGDVTGVGTLIADKMPGDPSGRTLGTIIFQGEHDDGVNTLTVPIGTNNSPSAVRQVVEVPPSGEAATSAMGKQRYYNQADLIIKVTDGGVVATSGLVNNFATTIPAAQVSQFVNTAVTFFNKRENDTIKTTQIDVAKLSLWNATNTVLRPTLPFGDVRIVYVTDQRTQSSSTQAGVRLVNGQTILPQGLTVATPNPLYVLGNYNVPNAALGTDDTSGSKPASFVADAITVLSSSWSDLNSSLGLDLRDASDTTVNAAFLAGIVPTTSGSYSGGVENFPRFLENWSGNTFTYNGSMVVMFPSTYATGAWQGTGSTIGIYNPPTRNWAFDQNFKNPAKLPPGTPSVRAVIRGSWASIKPSVAL